VLRFEMSLVGPRPLPLDEVKRFDDLSHRRRLSVRPGLTCTWQVSGRNDVKDFNIGCGWTWNTSTTGPCGWTSKFCGAQSGSCSWAKEDADPNSIMAKKKATKKAQPRSVVTGGAGFLGSHLVDYLLARGHHVVVLDNLVTGSVENIEHLAGRADFRFIKQDVTEFLFLDEPVDYVWHFASPASPVDYLELPIQTLKVGSLGTHKALGLAKHKRRGSCWLRPRRFTGTRWCIRNGRITGGM
jgi:hypothetical protein